jgi:hypothetical protein
MLQTQDNRPTCVIGRVAAAADGATPAAAFYPVVNAIDSDRNGRGRTGTERFMLRNTPMAYPRTM